MNNAKNMPLKQENNQADTAQVLEKFRDKLLASGMDQKTTGYLVGRLMGVISREMAAETVRVLGKEVLAELQSLKDDAERAEELSRRFKEKKGISLQEYRDRLADKFIKDFENAG